MNSFLENSIYKELGINPVIHAAGTKTTHGGTRMHPDVLEAMNLASKSFVNILELNRKVGEYIATITDSEAGMVTSGAASGVVLSIAACMTGTDISKVRKLPDAAGMKNELIIQRIHYGAYSHMYTFTGAKFVEIGNINDCLPEELESVINEKTAAVTFLLGPRISQTGLTLKQVTKIAHHYGIPVIVDAAATLPPKNNLKTYIKEGADLVTISGGKFIHGPQNTGLLFGRRDLIEAAYANSSPNHSIGRPHKVSKEQIVGLYAALKLYMEIDEEQIISNYRSKLEFVKKELDGISGLRLEIIHDGVNYNVPVLAIKFLSTWSGPSGLEFTKIMINSNPPIFMQYFKELGHLVVNPISLQEEEFAIVAHRLKEEFVKYV